jgi:hypothetical protein
MFGKETSLVVLTLYKYLPTTINNKVCTTIIPSKKINKIEFCGYLKAFVAKNINKIGNIIVISTKFICCKNK